MRICLVLEGSYPYIHGGVSTWMHSYIQNMPEHEFVLWVIGAKAKDRGKYAYKLPENVVEIHEVFLDDALRVRPVKKRFPALNDEEKAALVELMKCDRPDWNIICRLFQDKEINPGNFLMGEDFLAAFEKMCLQEYPYVPFADTFHTIRSMLLPVFYLLGTPVPKADLYHAICTGYGGLLAVLGNYKYQKPVVLSEHGIYSREREEEIIRAKWVIPSFKKQWIKFFYMLSDAIYQKASAVSCLFNRAAEIQKELGVPADRSYVIPNGIDYKSFSQIPYKEDDGWVDIGAVIRFAQIKDVKTLIYAFYELQNMRENVRLHILGGVDDEEYAQECYDLIKQLSIPNIVLAGRVDVKKYMEKLDFTILTSLSEGQPLSVLESLAAGRPCITTDVGCCRELLEGVGEDSFGITGYLAPPMHRKALALAMNRMCESRKQRIEMGKMGQLRVKTYYQTEMMMKKYREFYENVRLEKHGRNRI